MLAGRRSRIAGFFVAGVTSSGYFISGSETSGVGNVGNGLSGFFNNPF